MTQHLSLPEALCRDRYTLETVRLLLNGSFLRVVNYHNTRAADAAKFEREIAFFARHFVSVTPDDLDRFFDTRVWPYDRPGLIPAVFEGWRTHCDVFAPILEKYGFRGWFYVPAFFPDVPIAEQIAYCEPHSLRLFAQEDYDDPRCCMNWEEIRRLAERHEICCHTGSHCRVTDRMTPEEIPREIVESKRYLEEKTGREVSAFCWCGGDDYRGSAFFHSYLREAGYRFLVSNLKLERIGRKKG